MLKKEWMLQWNKTTTIHCSPKAQHIRKVENLERDLIETIKYGSKIFTEADLKKEREKSYSTNGIRTRFRQHTLHNERENNF